MTDDPELIAADKAKQLAKLNQAAAEARKSEQEALAAAAKTERDLANADRDAAMAHEKAKADNDKAIADARKAETEALAAAAKADRDLANADRDAAMADEKAKAENDKSIADARSAATKAWAPEPTTKPLEGTVTSAEGTGAIGRVAALQLLSDAAVEVAARVKAAGASRVLIVDNVDLAASDWAHALVNSQVERLRESAKRIKAAIEAAERSDGGTPRGAPARETRFLAGVGAAATVVPALVGAAADTAGYFRSDYTVGKVDVTTTSTPLIAAVAGALIDEHVTVYVDGFALFDRHTGTVQSFGHMLDARWGLLDIRLRASQGLLRRAKDAVTEATTARDEVKAAAAAQNAPADAAAKLADANEVLSTAQTKVAECQGLIDAATKIEDLIDTHVTAMTTVASGQSLPPLGQAALRDLLHRTQSDVNVLAVTINQIGADSIDRRSLFGRARVVYVGAAHVSALLLAAGGDVVVGASVARTSATRLYLSDGKIEPTSLKSNSESKSKDVGGWTTARAARPGVDQPVPVPPPAPAAMGGVKARWTLMVFMAGMNNLAQEADKDIDEILAGQPGDDVEVVIFVKQPIGARRFRVGHQPELLDNVDSGDPNTVVDFVRWATGVAPANHYALILWNHGSGWEPWAYDVDVPVAVRPVTTPNGVQKINSSVFPTALVSHVPDARVRQRAILTDDGTAHAVDTIELGNVAAAVAEHLGRKLDVLAMDACLMSNLEVAYEVRDHVEVVVGSEELEPGSGWHYTDLLGRLRADVDQIDAARFGTIAVASYLDGYQNTSEQVTQCAIRTAGAEDLRAAVDSLADSLAATMPDGRGLLTDALGDSRRFDGHLVDLGQLCESLMSYTANSPQGDPLAGVSAAASALLGRLAPEAGYVLAEGHRGQSLDGVHGVSIYLPARTDPYAGTYTGIGFARNGRWDELIQKFRDARRPVAPA